MTAKLEYTVILHGNPVLMLRIQRTCKPMANHFLTPSLHLRELPAVNITNTTSSTTEGWVSSPNGRGTIDILWACLITTFLCTWTSLHLNLPAPRESHLQRGFRRFRWMIQAFIAPELVVGLATGQKIEARRSVSLWKDSGYDKWTIHHGFYAMMGGFVLQPRDSKPFPVKSKQLHYLVTRGYTSFPAITEMEIRTKGKQDGFQKILTLLQLGWFVLQCLTRAIQHLPVTTLELATIGLVLCTLASYYQWFHKPLDAEEAIIITTQKSTAQILVEAGTIASRPYVHTPLDFIDKSPLWLTEIQPHLRFRAGPRERPLPRLPNDTLAVIGASLDAIFLFAIITTYTCIHFIAWDFHFPTQIERTLWRVNCIIMIAAAFIFFSYSLIDWQRWYLKLFPHTSMQKTSERAMRWVVRWRPIVMSAATVIYTAARVYIAVECFVSLRSLPTGVFDSVQWLNFVPHF